MSTAPRPLAAVILAAGKGTRMKSAIPKVLHTIAGRPLLGWVMEAALEAGAERIVVVVGHGKDEVEAWLAETYGGRLRPATVHQVDQRGTGHAAQTALPALDGFDGDVLITVGDAPLLRGATFRALADAKGAAPLSVLTGVAPDPTGYGRILRDVAGRVQAIREHGDATDAERAVDEINSGVYVADAAFLRDALPRLRDDNAQGELYLTDVVAAAAAGDGAVPVVGDFDELLGINDRAQLAEGAARLFRRIATAHARAGVTVRDLDRVSIEASVEIGVDAVLETGVVLRGATRIGAGATVDVGAVLTDVTVADGALVRPYTVATDSRIGEGAKVGPFSHLRPGSDLGPQVHVGNFVETKKTSMAEGSKANHLAYLGDGIIGPKVNVGAGTIFCNYDGFNKHTTVLEEGAFIGSDSQLVAPVTVGAGAYVATGTTVTRSVPPDALAIGRIKQSNKEGYASRLKARMRAKKEAAKREAAAKKR
jgi:bifunctional UDP-N-acetylglucosamine pyrophosphorylase/glucosamine-1-phosphate N-acetyltransferase